jgi:TRAP-type C4-dicarboxylate transport system permease small subunit
MMIFDRIRQLLIVFEKSVAIASLVSLLALSLMQIIARNFFDSGFNHVDVITRHLVLCVAFVGAALACDTDGNIKIDILATLLPQRFKKILFRPLIVFASAIAITLTWHALRFWQEEWQYAAESERTEVLFALVIPAGFAILALHFVLLGLSVQKERDAS